MKTMGVDWVATFIVLVSALVLFVIGLVASSNPSIPQEGSEHLVAATTALDIELMRCKTLGPDADTDAGCLKAWGIISKRFVEYDELHHGMAVNRSRVGRPGREGDVAGRLDGKVAQAVARR